MKYWSDNILTFFRNLKIKAPLPRGVVVLNPYADEQSYSLCEKFYTKYYHDANKRSAIIGINPGRLGAGLTGIPFTDPIRLHQVCHIENDLRKKAELSSDFIYRVIDSLSGPEEFYSRFYFSSVSPLGFTHENKNLNYYDLPKLQSALIPFIKDCFLKQLEFGVNTNICYVLGEGKNYAFLSRLNEQMNLFQKLVPLPHPRFIMQYKRKGLSHYVELYQRALGEG